MALFAPNESADFAIMIEAGQEVWLQMAEQIEDRFIAAYLHRVYGKLLLTQENQEEAMYHFQTAMDLFDEIGISHEVEKTRNEMRQ